MSGTGEEVLGPMEGPQEPTGNLGGGEEHYADVIDFTSPQQALQSKQREENRQKALADGNMDLAKSIEQQQIIQTKISQAHVDAAGVDPAMRAPNNAVPNTQVEVQRMMTLSIMRQEQVDMILDQHGWQEELEDWFTNDVIAKYKERNSSQLMVDTEGMDPAQRILAQEQLEPLVMDPELVAAKRQKLTQIDQALKLIDPQMSVFNQPRTSRTAGWINREASLGGGYIQSGEVEGVGFMGEVGGEISANVLAAGEAVYEFPAQLLFGGMELIGATPPSNYVEGPDGRIITNAGKIPNLTETWIAVAAQLQGANVAEELARNGKLQQIEQSRLSMIQQMSRGVSSVVGMGVGFGMAAGKAMQLGQKAAASLTTKGLVNLAASGSPKTAKMLQIMSSTAGASVGNGLAEGVAFGRHEGYVKSFWGGAAIAPVLMVFGAMGNRVEGMAHVKRMPKKVRKALAGGVEGMGFGVMEDYHQYREFEGSLWDYIQDPTQQRWMVYTKNAIGMAIFKAGAGRSALDMQAERSEQQAGEALQRTRGAFRRLFARNVEAAEREAGKPQEKTKEVAPEEAAVPEGTEARELTPEEREMQERAEAAGDTVGKAPTAEEMGRELERMRKEDEADAAAEERVRLAKEEPGFPEAEELARLRKEGPTAENRKRIIELLQRAKGAYIGKVGELYKTLGEQLPTDKWARGDKGPPRSQKITENREIAKEAGVDYEMVREMGEELRIAEDLEMPTERRQEALDRVREIEEALDTQELLADPQMNEQLREEIQAADLEARQAAEVDPQARQDPTDPYDRSPGPRDVDPRYGERYGPGSMRAGANPYRQEAAKALDTDLDIMVSEIFQIMEGKATTGGFKIGKWRIGRRKGSPVQIAMQAGHMGGMNALGVFKVFENLIRNREGQDLVVGVHEWSHGMHRQLFAGKGGAEFWAAAQKQFEAMPINAKLDVAEILRDYPGAQRLTKKQQMAEAWAEWHARYLLGDPNLLELHPDFSREMLKWLNAPEQRAFRDGQYRDLKVAINQWKDMGARRRVGMTVRREGRKPKDYDASLAAKTGKGIEKVVKAFFDDNIALKNSQERWLERSDLKPEDLSILMDPSRMIDTVQMTAQKEAESYMLRGPHDLAFRRKHGIESYADIMKGVAGEGTRKEKNARIIDFVDLLYATRALEKIGKGKQMPTTVSDYRIAIKEISEANPTFVKKVEAMKQWTDSLVDLLVEAGQIGKKDAQLMKDEGMTYIPFVRMIDGAVSRFHSGRGVAETGTGLKSFRSGSRDELMDPVKAMEDVTRSMIVKARKQMVVRGMYRLMLETDIGGLATQVPKDNVPARYRLDQVMRSMKKALGKETAERLEKGEMEEVTAEELEETFGIFAELVKDNELSETLMTLFGQKDLPHGEKDPILAYVPRLTEAEINALPNANMQKQARENNGKMIWLQLDPAAFESLMGIDAPISRMVIDSPVVNALLRKPAQVLRFFATDANPAFAASNLLRDMASVSVFDRRGKFSPFSGFIMAAQGAALQLRHGSRLTPHIDKLLGNQGDPASRALWEMFDASGASTSSFFNEGVRREMRGQTRNLMQKVEGALDSWKRAIAAPESWIRVAEFARIVKEGTKEGRDPVEVSYEALEGAREITVNFARAGDIARAYNQMTPYFTATLAGQRRMIRALLGQEGRTEAERGRMMKAAWANGFVGITVPTMAAWLMVKDEDWYQDLPEWRKRHFVNMKLPGSDEILSLPLPFELGSIFGSIPMGFADQATDGNPIDIMDTMQGALFPYFEHTSSWIPAAVKPTLETITNRDLFRERDLTPFWVEKTKRPEDQMRAGTTIASQKLFKALPPLQWLVDNPIELEQWMSGHTAGGTSFLLQAIDEITGLKDHPGINLGVGPLSAFQNRFMRQKPHGASRTVDELYQEAKRIEQTPSAERTPGDRSRLTRINRAKEEFSRLRRERDLGRMERTEADRRMFEISNRIMESVK